VGKEAPFEKLEIKRQFRRRLKDSDRPIKVLGFDSESHNGYCKLLCDSRGYYEWVESFQDIVSFLTRKSLQGKANFFWNLKYDAETFIKYLGAEVCKELLKGRTVKVDGVKVTYLRYKLFKLQKCHKVWKFYDLANFFDHDRLSSASLEYLGEAKQEISDLQEKVAQKSNEVISYCKRDAELTQRLGEFMVQAFQRLGVKPKNFYSPASIAERLMKQNCFIPTVQKIPGGALEYAYKSYRGGWIEALKKGYFEKVYLYDLNGAYLAEIKNLPSLRHGFWVKRNEPPRRALWGFVRCRVKMKQMKHLTHPIAYKYKSLNFYPFGMWDCYLEWKEVEFLREKGIADVEIYDGWFFLAWEPDFPFEGLVEDIWEHRRTAQLSGDRYLDYATKKLSVSL